MLLMTGDAMDGLTLEQVAKALMAGLGDSCSVSFLTPLKLADLSEALLKDATFVICPDEVCPEEVV